MHHKGKNKDAQYSSCGRVIDTCTSSLLKWIPKEEMHKLMVLWWRKGTNRFAQDCETKFASLTKMSIVSVGVFFKKWMTFQGSVLTRVSQCS